MKRNIFKVFTIGAFEEEEKWLTKMDAQGLRLVHAGFCNYTFEEAAPGGYIYRLELLDNMPSHPESQAYIRFIEETGVEYIGSVLRWGYFRKKAEDGNFELFSDSDSKIRHYRRIMLLSTVVSIIWIFGAATNITNGIRLYNKFNLNQMNNFNGLPQYAYNFIWAGIYLFILLLLQGTISPLYKRLRRLKKVKSISE